MAESSDLTLNPNNLISGTNFPRNWKTINLSQAKARWVQDKEFVIRQINEVGSRRNGSGSILVLRNRLETNFIELKGNPGTVGQFGLVFNYLDKDNFGLFVIDQHGKSFKGYDILIGEVISGKFSRKNEDKFDSNVDPSLSLQIIVTDQGEMEFRHGHRTLYKGFTWSLSSKSRIGLYNAKNNGIYESLIAINETIVKDNDDSGLDINENDLDTSNVVLPTNQNPESQKTVNNQNGIDIHDSLVT